VETTYERPTKRTGKGGSSEEQRDPIELFIPLVPHAQIEHDSGEEPGFRRTQKEAGDEESGKALSEIRQGANGTPHKGESRKPEPRSGEFEDDVCRLRLI